MKGRGRGEAVVVPPAEFSSYYGQPVLNEPTWKALDIAGYLFLGGLAGASSITAAMSQATGRGSLARSLKVGALGAIGLSAAALVHDLGRPERFVNMLRVMKPTSAMSMGSWLLAAYGPAVGVAAGTSVTGWMPGVGAVATGAAAVLGAGVASYTGVLIADTAVPAWHGAFRQLPYVFVSSAATAASGLALAVGPAEECGPLLRLAPLAATTEVRLLRRAEHELGLVGETYRIGRAGQLLGWAERLTLGGALVATTVGRVSSPVRRLAGVSLVAGSALTRFAIFQAGIQSTRDPKYVVVPQRVQAEQRGGGTDS